MKLAAIDLGSNAVRLLIREIAPQLAYYNPRPNPATDILLRVPVQLGNDAYSGSGAISEAKINQLQRVFVHFATVMQAQGVTHYEACATAALRAASNGPEVARLITDASGIALRIIPGEEEAGMAPICYFAQQGAHRGAVLFTDVGGGSSDICLATPERTLYVASFPVGSMRLSNGTQDAEAIESLRQALANLHQTYGPTPVVGIGGSIHKISQLLGNPLAADTERLRQFHTSLQGLSIEMKQALLNIPRNRAEIIAEASEIFLTIADSLSAPQIQTPAVTLRDAIIVRLLQRQPLT